MYIYKTEVRRKTQIAPHWEHRWEHSGDNVSFKCQGQRSGEVSGEQHPVSLLGLLVLFLTGSCTYGITVWRDLDMIENTPLH